MLSFAVILCNIFLYRGESIYVGFWICQLICLVNVNHKFLKFFFNSSLIDNKVSKK